ncbi:UvrD-helicase domain-containing protein [Christiangramia crocea]|uniref:DNA 3'-5' helicase II n=1 Tax=Christiangramia crocea TaxID=2904124 RepID=A0A9X2A4B4_9FLAO|nr:UvrD-helicase domain-containing protein [Gramella crocea]MCG9970514.1 UvrD-helicase domain-containing protein [Gramella crocea]
MLKKPKLVIAGPGAGKTFGMVNEIIHSLSKLSPARYMIVITYTNSATNNIKDRLAKRIQIPPNLFIGTMHSFLNKFIVIPFSSFHNNEIKGEKLFIQCQTDDIFEKLKKESGKTYDFKVANFIKKKIRISMQKNGYITYDQTVTLAKECFENKRIKRIISNRIQYLFVDEFQDTSNNIFYIIDSIRKEKMTQIYCVGDPEQYIQSFASTIKNFSNIPILKSSKSKSYELSVNNSNYRTTESITTFLNNFNGRNFGSVTFKQNCINKSESVPVKFLNEFENVSNLVPPFFSECDKLNIGNNDRCILAKKNDIVRRVISALDDNYIPPLKSNNLNPIKEIMATLLSSLNLNQSEYLKKYNSSIFDLRKICIQILKRIKDGTIYNENTFFNYVRTEFELDIKTTVPVKIQNLRINNSTISKKDAVVVSNIHNYKGLESEAVLAIAKTEEELLLWIETDQKIRDSKRNIETTDYPRLGYVAFSRARKLLCISCLEKISNETEKKLNALDVQII